MNFTRDEIIKNRLYYSFYMELSNNGNSIRETTGVFKVTMTKRDRLGYGSYTVGGKTSGINVTNRLNGIKPLSGIECKFFENEEEAKKAYNKQIDDFTFWLDSDKQKRLKQKHKL